MLKWVLLRNKSSSRQLNLPNLNYYIVEQDRRKAWAKEKEPSCSACDSRDLWCTRAAQLICSFRPGILSQPDVSSQLNYDANNLQFPLSFVNLNFQKRTRASDSDSSPEQQPKRSRTNTSATDLASTLPQPVSIQSLEITRVSFNFVWF